MTVETDDPATGDDQDQRNVVDAATPEGVAKQRKATRRVKTEAEEFWGGALSTEAGRRQIFEHITSGGAFTTPFAVSPSGFPQPEATWFTAGQRAFVEQFFHRLMVHDFDGVKLMLLENDERFKESR